MQRFFKGMLCFAVLCLLSGCTIFQAVSNRFAQKSRAILHPETKAPTQKCPTSQICLMDPFARGQKTSSSAPATGKASIMELPETTLDFGTMDEDKEYVHKFAIKNAGRSQLKIKKVIPG